MISFRLDYLLLERVFVLVLWWLLRPGLFDTENTMCLQKHSLDLLRILLAQYNLFEKN